MCQSKPRDSSKQVSEFRCDDSDIDELFIGVLGTKPLTQKDWMQSVVINKLQVNMQCNVLPYTLYCKPTREKMKKSKTRLVSYTGHKIPVMGKATLSVKRETWKPHPVEFQIIEHSATPVIGLQTCHELNLVKSVSSVDTKGEENRCNDTNQDVNEILQKYEDVFDDIGCLEGTYQIKIDPTVSPVVHPPRKIPFTQRERERVKEKLDRMETLCVIRKAEEPTEWVSSLVVVEKPNCKVRLCLDPRDPNKAIQREHYPMETGEEVAAELSI